MHIESESPNGILEDFRIEFLNETPAQVTQTIVKYRQLLCGEITGAELWRELKLLIRVSRGDVDPNPVQRLAIDQLTTRWWSRRSEYPGHEVLRDYVHRPAV